MFLLIPDREQITTNKEDIFTFQYVSINTVHSMKYSVIRKLFTFQYVSINTLDPSSTDNIQRVFTFQYVSINTKSDQRCNNCREHLHSNMFLLILRKDGPND